MDVTTESFETHEIKLTVSDGERGQLYGYIEHLLNLDPDGVDPGRALVRELWWKL